MDHPPPNRPAAVILFGCLAATIGLYFTLVGLSLLPPPGGQHAPGWVVVAAGLAFLLGGMFPGAAQHPRARATARPGDKLALGRAKRDPRVVRC